MKLGDAFTLPNEYGVRHLHVIISDPAQSSDETLWTRTVKWDGQVQPIIAGYTTRLEKNTKLR